MKQFRRRQICLGDCLLFDRLTVFLCRQTVFQIDLHSEVGLCIVVILRLLWAICLLISMNGLFLRRNHSLVSPGYYHNPKCQLSISVFCLIHVRKKWTVYYKDLFCETLQPLESERGPRRMPIRD